MRNLLALLLFVPSLCLAQTPDYVPMEGLVGWFPFDSSAVDQSVMGNNGLLIGGTYGNDRLNNPSGAVELDGEDDSIEIIPFNGVDDGSSVSISFWAYQQSPAITDQQMILSEYNGSSSEGDMLHWGYRATESNGCPNGNCVGFDFYTTAIDLRLYSETQPASSWIHWVLVFDADSSAFAFYRNGELLDNKHPVATWNGNFNLGVVLGAVDYANLSRRGYFHGLLDDVGIWNTPLDSVQAWELYSSSPLITGCTDQTACNYDSSATADNESCQYGCLYCGEGTMWDSTLQECVGVVPPADSILVPIPSCGEGTVWDPVNEECIIAIPADLNYDGCISVNDLLILLAVHGTCPPYPEWPDEPNDTTWTCGDPVTYWDYDYATVLIGDQCWFAENLATTQYTDGTVIDSGLSNSEWASTTTGAQAAYDDDEAVVSTHGRLYNGYAVDDTRGLCPTNWSVPNDSDFIHLEENLGMSTEDATSLYWRGSDEGRRLKSTTWQNGLDEVGFSALPHGGRNHSSGNFLDDGAIGYWWTKTFNIDGLFYRRLDSAEDRIFRTYPSMNYGFSVRCIKD